MKRRIRIILVIAVFLSLVSGKAIAAPSAAPDESVPADSLTALRVFAGIPLDVLDMIRPSSRLDMIDYYSQADSLWSAPNAAGGKSRFLEVTDDYLRLEVTPASTLEIKILPRGKDRIVMTLYTVGGDGVAKDTDVRFFDSAMAPIADRKMLKIPDLKDFFRLKESGIKVSELKELVPFEAVCCSTGPGDLPLSVTLTSLEFLPQETRTRLESLFIPSLTANWNGKAFKF